MSPVLGREFVKGEQQLLLVGDLRDRFRPLRAELIGERFDGTLSLGLVFGTGDLVDRTLGSPMDGLW